MMSPMFLFRPTSQGNKWLNVALCWNSFDIDLCVLASDHVGYTCCWNIRKLLTPDLLEGLVFRVGIHMGGRVRIHMGSRVGMHMGGRVGIHMGGRVGMHMGCDWPSRS